MCGIGARNAPFLLADTEYMHAVTVPRQPIDQQQAACASSAPADAGELQPLQQAAAPIAESSQDYAGDHGLRQMVPRARRRSSSHRCDVRHVLAVAAAVL